MVKTLIFFNSLKLDNTLTVFSIRPTIHECGWPVPECFVSRFNQALLISLSPLTHCLSTPPVLSVFSLPPRRMYMLLRINIPSTISLSKCCVKSPVLTTAISPSLARQNQCSERCLPLVKRPQASACFHNVSTLLIGQGIDAEPKLIQYTYSLK